MINEGSTFPDFLLMDQDGRQWRLQDFSGAMVVFYFYPKDDTSGCTVEACEFRDELPYFPSVQVVGVSPDAPKSHRKFAEKYSLPFTLLADVDHVLAEACGVWVEKSMYGRTYMGIERSTFLVDADGVVLRIWRKVKPQGHAEEVLQAIT